ncbi:putative mediator of RNA polymerase II transcription subunit 37c, partial [Bienertia sinuspersici]
RNILVFDLGGGTYDVSLVTVEKGSFVVKAISGDNHLGGQDFDNSLVSHLIDEFKRKYNKDISGHPRALRRLRTACEREKRTLSTTTQTTIEIDCLYEGIDFSSTISRARFEKLNMDLFGACLGPVGKCLQHAKIERSRIDDVVLVGGSTRIPKVQKLLSDFFNGKDLCKSLNPDEAIAYGAAIHASISSGVRKNSNFLLVDITPLSLGVEIIGHRFSIAIPKNTAIPTKMEANHCTVVDNQTGMSAKVYEGESSNIKENNFLGELTLYNIPPALAGVACVTDCFTIDANCILTVTSTVRSTGNKDQIMITSHSGRLSKEEIDRMIEDAKRLNTEDILYRKAIKGKLNLENYVNNVWNTVKGESGVKIDLQEKRMLEDAIERAMQWLEWNYHLNEACKLGSTGMAPRPWYPYWGRLRYGGGAGTTKKTSPRRFGHGGYGCVMVGMWRWFCGDVSGTAMGKTTVPYHLYRLKKSNEGRKSPYKGFTPQLIFLQIGTYQGFIYEFRTKSLNQLH